MKKLVILVCLCLPVACLLGRWDALPAQVPLHFTRGGADAYGDKHLLWGVALVPVLLYAALPLVAGRRPAGQGYQPLGMGVALVLSLLLCAWLVAMPAG